MNEGGYGQEPDGQEVFCWARADETEVVSMTTFQVVVLPEESTGTSTQLEDSLQSELFFSAREAGVACFVDMEDDDEV
jgi:hypothetical protein